MLAGGLWVVLEENGNHTETCTNYDFEDWIIHCHPEYLVDDLYCDVYCGPFGGIYDPVTFGCDWRTPEDEFGLCPAVYENWEGEVTCDTYCLGTGGHYETIVLADGLEVDSGECVWSNVDPGF